MVMAAKGYGMLARVPLMPCARGHYAEPDAVVGLDDIWLIAIPLARNFAADVRPAKVAPIGSCGGSFQDLIFESGVCYSDQVTLRLRMAAEHCSG